MQMRIQSNILHTLRGSSMRYPELFLLAQLRFLHKSKLRSQKIPRIFQEITVACTSTHSTQIGGAVLRCLLSK